MSKWRNPSSFRLKFLLFHTECVLESSAASLNRKIRVKNGLIDSQLRCDDLLYIPLHMLRSRFNIVLERSHEELGWHHRLLVG